MISLKQTTIPAVTVAQPAYNEWSLSRYLQAASVPPPEKGKQLEKLVFNIYQGISHFNKFYMPVLHLGQRSETSGSAWLPAVVKYLPITYDLWGQKVWKNHIFGQCPLLWRHWWKQHQYGTFHASYSNLQLKVLKNFLPTFIIQQARYRLHDRDAAMEATITSFWLSHFPVMSS